MKNSKFISIITGDFRAKFNTLIIKITTKYFYFILFTLSLFATACSKENATVMNSLSPTEQAFNKAFNGMCAAGIPEGQMLDSIVVRDDFGNTSSSKFDQIKSSKDTIVIKTANYNVNNTPQAYGTEKFYRDENGILSSKNYISKNSIYSDPQQIYRNTTKYTEEGDAIVTSIGGTKTFKFIPQDLKTVLKQNYNDPSVKYIFTNVFSSVK